MSEEREAAFGTWVEDYRKGKPYWSTARVEICRDAWQAALEWQAARQSAGATGQQPIGYVNSGWLENRIGVATIYPTPRLRLATARVYAAPIGDNGAQRPRQSSGSLAFDYANALIDDRLNASYAKSAKQTQAAESKRVELSDAYREKIVTLATKHIGDSRLRQQTAREMIELLARAQAKGE